MPFHQASRISACLGAAPPSVRVLENALTYVFVNARLFPVLVLTRHSVFVLTVIFPPVELIMCSSCSWNFVFVIVLASYHLFRNCCQKSKVLNTVISLRPAFFERSGIGRSEFDFHALCQHIFASRVFLALAIQILDLGAQVKVTYPEHEHQRF